ncbi:MAG: hypothetical protein KBT20_03190 [Bacteroidales bacterium]|nr:hypothetical protein [Candidatus Liminaster caballi]
MNSYRYLYFSAFSFLVLLLISSCSNNSAPVVKDNSNLHDQDWTNKMQDSTFCMNSLESRLKKTELRFYFKSENDLKINIESIQFQDSLSVINGNCNINIAKKEDRYVNFEFVYTLRDTSAYTFDLDVYDLTKDCFGKDAKFLISRTNRGNFEKVYHQVGERVKIEDNLYVDIIEGNELSQVYCTKRKLTQEYVMLVAEAFSMPPVVFKAFCTYDNKSDYYATVEHYKNSDNIVYTNMRTNRSTTYDKHLNVIY